MGGQCSSERTEEPKDTFSNQSQLPKGARICVVGAGASGLFAARWLKKNGYEVEVFDPSDHVGGPVTSVAGPDGKVHDTATKYIPSTDAFGMGPHPAFQEAVEEYKIKLQGSAGPASYDEKTMEKKRLPAALEKFEPSRIIQDLVVGFNIIMQLSRFHGVRGAYQSGLVQHGETMEEWGHRMKLPAFAALVMFFNDTFGAGPTAHASAAWALSYRKHYATTFISQVVKKALAKASWFDALKLRMFLHMKGHPMLNRFLEEDHIEPFLIVSGGYLSLYEAMVAQEKLVVHLRQGVTGMRWDADSKQWEVKSFSDDQKKEEVATFDGVVVSTPPFAYKEFLPDADITQLMSKCTAGPLCETFLVNLKEWKADNFHGKLRGTWVFYHAASAFATANLAVNNQLYAICKEYEDSNVVTTISYAHPESTLDENEVIVRNTLQSLGLEVDSVIHRQNYPWPVRAPPAEDKAGWQENVHELQGVNNMFYVGEALYGAGVMAIVDGIAYFMPKFFKSHVA